MMTKHCGLNKFWIFFVAALFCLTLAAPQSRADLFPPGSGVINQLHIGPEECVQTDCMHWWDSSGGSGTPSSVNLIQGFWDQDEHLFIDYNADSGANLFDPVLLIFAIPKQNLFLNFPAFDPFFDGSSTLTVNPGFLDYQDLIDNYGGGVIDPVKLYLGNWSAGPAVDVTSLYTDPLSNIYSVGTTDWPDDYNSGNPLDQGGVVVAGPPGPGGHPLESALKLTASGNTGAASNMANAALEIPARFICLNTLPAGHTATDLQNCIIGLKASGDLIRPTEFSVWAVLLQTDQFGPNDVFDVKWRNIPAGTFVFAWGHNCTSATEPGNCAVAQSLTESAMLMPLAQQVPEPTSLLLLGTGLLFVGRQWRKRKA